MEEVKLCFSPVDEILERISLLKLLHSLLGKLYFKIALLFIASSLSPIINKASVNLYNVSGIAEIGERIRYLNFIGEKPIYSELNELDFINFVMISEAAAEKYFTKLSNNKNFNSETRALPTIP